LVRSWWTQDHKLSILQREYASVFTTMWFSISYQENNSHRHWVHFKYNKKDWQEWWRRFRPFYYAVSGLLN
jgi:hypothetical protein